MNIRKLSKEELEKIIRENKLFTQKDLAVYFNENIGIITNNLVKHGIRLINIKREEVLKFIKENPAMTLEEIADIFDVSKTTISRIKKKAGLSCKSFIKYKKLKKHTLKRILRECKNIKTIVNRYGGDEKRWREILVEKGVYKIDAKRQRRNVKEKFLKLYEEQGEKLFLLKDKRIAEILECSVSYVNNLRIKYAGKTKQANTRGECAKKIKDFFNALMPFALKIKNEEIAREIGCSKYTIKKYKTELRKKLKQKDMRW